MTIPTARGAAEPDALSVVPLMLRPDPTVISEYAEPEPADPLPSSLLFAAAVAPESVPELDVTRFAVSEPTVISAEPFPMINFPLVRVPVFVTLPVPVGVAHVPSPRQNVVELADVPLLRFPMGRLPVTPLARLT
jgi:hypothetical protein